MAGQAVQIAAVTGLPDGQSSHPVAAAADDAYTARLHTSLEAVRPLWLRYQADGVCTAHQHYAWAEGIVAGLMPKGAELLIVEVNDAATGAPRMLVPLMRRPAFRHRVIEWLSCGVCDYAAPLLADASPWTRQSAQAAWAAVLSVLPPADRIHIMGIPQRISGVANPLALLAGRADSNQTTFGSPSTATRKPSSSAYAGHPSSRPSTRTGAGSNGSVAWNLSRPTPRPWSNSSSTALSGCGSAAFVKWAVSTC